MKRWLIYILIFVLGAASGIVGTAIYGYSTFSGAASIVHLFYRAAMLDYVYDAYVNESTDTAIWAMNVGIELLEKELETFENVASDETELSMMDTMILYTRLAICYERVGKVEAAEKSMNRVIELANTWDKEQFKTRESAMALIKRIDEK